MPGRARPIRVLIAIFGLVARRLLDFDAGEIGFEFVGDHHRHAGAHALAHFRADAKEGQSAVGREREEEARIVAQAIGHACAGKFLVDGANQFVGLHWKPQCQREGCRAEAKQSRAAADSCNSAGGIRKSGDSVFRPDPALNYDRMCW